MNRTQEGVVLIDKPPGLTSFGVVEQVRHLFRHRKVGHTGTLDPFATGLLVLCLGKATRLSPYITDWDKTYEGTIRLGAETDTDDPAGHVTFFADPEGVTLERLNGAIEGFRGEILQIPPRYSAKKRDGVPSYRRARRGEKVDLGPVSVRIDQLEIVSMDIPWVRFRATCSKGTYMRSLARDLGRVLGCGGHLAELCRTGIGHLRVEQAHPLEEIKARNVQDRESLLLPVEEVLSPWTALSLTEEGEQKVRYGQDLPAEDIREQDMELLQEGSCVRLIGDCGKFLGIGRVIHKEPGLTIHPEKVWACCG